MGGFSETGYDPRTEEELFNAYLTAIEAEYDDELEPYEGSFARSLFLAFSRAVSKNQEPDLEDLYDSLFVELADGDQLTMLARQYGAERREAIAATGVVEWSRSVTDSDQVIPAGTIVETEEPNVVSFDTRSSVTLNGTLNPSDSSTYTTSSTSFVTKTSFTIDAAFRDTLDVNAEYRTTDSNYTAYLEIVDATNATTIATDNTTSTSTVTLGETSYDISNIEEEITIEYRIRISDSAGTAELSFAEAIVPGQYGERQNIVAQEPGAEGNIGADRITVMPSPPPNVQGVTNPQPTGDADFTLYETDEAQQIGLDRETDEELAERTLEKSSIGGSATVRAVRDKIRDLGGTPSLTIYTNRQDFDDANGNGIPALSTELVIYARGVGDKEIATAIFESVAVTQKLVNGINGTAQSYTISENVLKQDWVIKWSTPIEIQLEITADLVTEPGYVGDSVVRDTIADYVGGTAVDGGLVPGLEVGEDLITDEFESRLTDLDGVIGVSSFIIDADGDGTDDTTIRSDGLQAYEVATNEVAIVDATEDITVNS